MQALKLMGKRINLTSVGNFCEAEIFVIKQQLAKISSHEKSFLQTFLADDKLRKPTTLSSSSGSHNFQSRQFQLYTPACT